MSNDDFSDHSEQQQPQAAPGATHNGQMPGIQNGQVAAGQHTSNQDAPSQFAQAPYPPNQYPPNQFGQLPPGAPAKSRNTIGLIAVILAAIGFIFGCIPGALIVGWILLPIAFILGIVGLCQSGKDKGTSIAAVIVSVIGTIVAAVVFVAVVADAVDDAFDEVSGGDVSVSQDGEVAADDIGSRDKPAALGSTLSSAKWKVVVNKFTRDATDEVMAANQFNDEPAKNSTWALVNLTVTYRGSDSAYADDVSVAFVSDSGKTYKSYDPSAVVPEPKLDGELYKGGSTTGNIAIQIPKDAKGLLRVSLGTFGKEVFVKIA